MAMDFDLEGARKAGYSDKAIADYLATETGGFDIDGAIKSGHNYKSVVDYLMTLDPSTPEAPVAPVAPKRQKPQPQVLPDSDTSSDFVRGIRNYLPQLQETYGAGKALTGLVASKLGADEFGKSLMESGTSTMERGQGQQVVRESDSLTRAFEKGIGTVLTDWLPYQMGSGLANIAETLGFMVVGSGVGAVTGAGVGALPGAVTGALSKTLVKQGVKDMAEKLLADAAAKGLSKEAAETAAQKLVENEAKKALVSMGSKAGRIGQAGLHGAGEVTSRAIEEAGGDVRNIDLGRVLPAAVAHGVADYFINKIGLDSLKIGEKAVGNLALEIGKRIGVTGLKEIPAEEIQTVAERYGARLSLADAEALREYIDTAGAAFGMSVVPGAIGGARTHVAKKFEDLATKAKKEQEEAEKVADAEQKTAPALKSEISSLLGLTPPPAVTTQPPPPAPTVNAPEQIQGAPSVTGTEQQSAGVGTEVAGGPPAAKPPAGPAGIDTDGVDVTGEIAGTTAVGKEAKPAAVATADTTPPAATATTAAPAAPAQPAAQPSKIDDVKRRRYELENLIVDDGLPETHGKVKNKLKTLNALEQELGLTQSTYDNISFDEPSDGELSAKKPTTLKGKLQHFLRTGQKDTGLVAVENDTHPAYKYDPTLSSAENLQAAMELGQKYDQQDQQEKQRLLDESRQRKEPRYIATEQERQLYEQVRSEHNAQAEEHNKKRAELQEKYKQAQTEQEANSIKSELDELGPDQYLLPLWTDLEKDIYFGNMQSSRTDNIYAHRVAAEDLIDHYKRTRGRTEVPLTASEQRIVNAYEENRREMSRLAGLQFPRWGDLSNESKKAYLGQITNNAGLQQEQAFFAAGKQIISENETVSAVSRSKEQKALEQRRKEVREEAEKNAAELQRLQKVYERLSDSTKFSGGLGYRLPNNVIEMLRKGHLQAALEELGNKLVKNPDARNKMAGQIIKLMSQLGLKTKIIVSKEPLSNNDLGQYDPMTDTIKLDASNGLSVTTLLHEVLHAASVKVMNLYLTGNKGRLTERQIRGVEQILRIMEYTKDELGATKRTGPDGKVEIIYKDYANAYENPFEFLAYALSDRFFQAELEAMGILYGETAEGYAAVSSKLKDQFSPDTQILSILPQDKNMWSGFKRAIAGILGVPVGAMKSYSFMMELNAALEDIASAPIEPTDIGPMSAKQPKQAPAITKAEEKAVDSIYEDDTRYDIPDNQVPRGWSYFKNLFTTVEGWKTIAAAVENDRYFGRSKQRQMELANQLHRDGPEMNNFDDQLTLSSSRARNLFNRHIAQPREELNTAITNYAKAVGLNTKKALNRLHRIIEALHEPERRMIKYLKNVPLSTAKTLRNGTISPADLRDQIFKALETELSTDKNQAKQIAQALRKLLDSVVFQTDANGNIIYKDNLPQPSKNVDPLGSSPRARVNKKTGNPTPLPTNFDNDAEYSSTGLTFAAVQQRLAEIKADPNKAEIDAVTAALKKVTDATADMNREARYWSTPVDNIVNFYGWNYYAPFKGKGQEYEKDADLSFHRYRKGYQFQDMPEAMGGRKSVSFNPLLQALSDATRSSLRAGLKDVTTATKNAVLQGHIPGEVKTIKYADRETEFEKGKHKGERTIFHFNSNGDIDIIRITDPKLLDSIRRTYSDAKPWLDMLNTVTSEIGKQHTRYNFQFAPMNFVRDGLTNAFTIGADLGPAKAAKFIGDISNLVVMHNGLYKAFEVAILYESSSPENQAALQQLAKKDPYYKSMIEMIEEGGLVSYLQSLTIKSNFQQLHKEVGRSGILNKKEQFEKFVDIWTDMFEIASRSAAYSLVKADALANNESEQAAKVRAAAYAKNLANFEHIGKYGKMMGAAYMFARPAAVGAVRAIEAVAPAFTPLSWAEKRLPPKMSDEAKEAYLDNYAELQKNARVMSSVLFGLGAIGYAMASMFSDDDDLGRNAVATDNMQQWTRFLRFHIPRKLTEAMGIKEPVVFQMPWGFGLGSFMASGAQVAAYVAGRQSFKDMSANIFLQIALDSFVPIPVSRMPFSDSPLNFVIDSITPSIARPLIEFALNKNGLGQDIYNDANRRFGDAYTGGDKVPAIYKDVAEWMADNSIGAIFGEVDVSPNTLYFLANSYLDGVSRIAETVYGIIDPLNNRPPFNPKTDLVLLGSFFGARSNVDSREFSSVEKKILDMEKKIKMYETNPVAAANYAAEHPLDQMLVDMYNKQTQGELKKLRTLAKEARLDKALPADARRDLVKIYTLQENIAKRSMIETFKAYGVEP